LGRDPFGNNLELSGISTSKGPNWGNDFNPGGGPNLWIGEASKLADPCGLHPSGITGVDVAPSAMAGVGTFVYNTGDVCQESEKNTKDFCSFCQECSSSE
jgi:hypothetical protein